MKPTRKHTRAQECRHCSSLLVQPVEWSREDHGWFVLLRCPDCEAYYQLDLDQEEVNQFSFDLESGFQSLLEGLEALEHEVFQTQCEAFIAAIHAGQVFPMDF